jgi:pSer/pThr/pTyr-binding forkhead associated (FHA) protein
MIHPCNCSGTMKYIHFLCLQQWLKSKIVVKPTTTENCITYSLKQIECELCKCLLPDYIKYKGRMFEMWDFKPQFKSYISFETIITEKNANRNIYIVNIDSKHNIRIGRGHDSDIRITDISVSRFHSLIRRTKDGNFYIEDNNSKFGTLVMIQNPKMQILSDNVLPIQIGKSFIQFFIKKPFSLFSCFSTNKKKEKGLDYQILNSKNLNFENNNFIKIHNDDTIVDDEDEGVDGLPSNKMLEGDGNNISSLKKAENPTNITNTNNINIQLIKEKLKKDLDSLRNMSNIRETLHNNLDDSDISNDVLDNDGIRIRFSENINDYDPDVMIPSQPTSNNIRETESRLGVRNIIMI